MTTISRKNRQIIPPNFLAKEGGQWRRISLLSLSVMLANTFKAANDENIGFEDARETLESLTTRLNSLIWIDPNKLESMLWSCNLLNEQGKFTHYADKSFDAFLKEIFPNASFNKTFNTLEYDGRTHKEALIENEEKEEK